MIPPYVLPSETVSLSRRLGHALIMAAWTEAAEAVAAMGAVVCLVLPVVC
jgi:hypothetical protein